MTTSDDVARLERELDEVNDALVAAIDEVTFTEGLLNKAHELNEVWANEVEGLRALVAQQQAHNDEQAELMLRMARRLDELEPKRREIEPVKPPFGQKVLLVDTQEIAFFNGREWTVTPPIGDLDFEGCISLTTAEMREKWPGVAEFVPGRFEVSWSGSSSAFWANSGAIAHEIAQEVGRIVDSSPEAPKRPESIETTAKEDPDEPTD